MMARTAKAAAVVSAVVGLATLAAGADAPRVLVRVYDCPADAVTDVAISPDERYIAQAIVVSQHSGEAGDPRPLETVRLLEFRKQCAVLPAQTHSDPPGKPPAPNGPQLYGLHFTADGGMVVFADGASLHVLRAGPMQEAWQFVVPVRDHPTRIKEVAVARDARVAALLASPVHPHRRPGEAPQLTRRPEFLHLFRVYDLEKGTVGCELALPREFSAVGLALSPDASRAAITVAPSDYAEVGRIPDLLIVDARIGAILQRFRVHTYGQVAFADNNTIFALGVARGGYHRVFRLVDVNTGQVLREIPEPKDRTMTGLSASAGGRYVGSWLWRFGAQRFPPLGGVADEFGVWDGASGELIARLKINRLTPLKLSNTGRFLVAGTRIFELELGKAGASDNSNSGSH